MIDHISLHVSDYAKAKKFYLQALKPLGYEMLMEFGNAVGGFGEGGKADLWISQKESSKNAHIAFRAKNRETVIAFYTAALEAGAKDNGAPGLRPNYHKNYFGAFVLDPDGNNIEVVCHEAE
jgi:catechol 2,3-dioxygenase-like lactoylglutathione lyase family enzyme